MKSFALITPDDMAALTLEAEITYGDGDYQREWQVLLLNLEEEYAKKKLETLMAELHKTEKSKGDTTGIILEIHAVSKRIQEVKSRSEKM